MKYVHKAPDHKDKWIDDTPQKRFKGTTRRKVVLFSNDSIIAERRGNRVYVVLLGINSTSIDSFGVIRKTYKETEFYSFPVRQWEEAVGDADSYTTSSIYGECIERMIEIRKTKEREVKEQKEFRRQLHETRRQDKLRRAALPEWGNF